jgi:F0F1-type ATP synthase assembly protein I
LTEQNDRRLTAAGQSTKYLGVGLTWVASTVFFLYVGSWVDGRLGSKPWFTVIGAFVGAVAGFYYLMRRLSEDMPPPRKPDRKG